MPEESFKIFNQQKENDYPFVFDEDMYTYIKYKIQTNCVNFNNLYEVTEGLDNKIIKEISSSTSYNDLVLKIKSKRYTFSKISRILTHIFIGLDNFNINELNDESNLYARVLGFNKTGREMLSLIKANSNLLKTSSLDNPKLLSKNIKIANIDINIMRNLSLFLSHSVLTPISLIFLISLIKLKKSELRFS